MNVPSPALGAPAPARRLRTWLLAARPKTLTAAVAPVAVGTGLAFGAGAGRWPLVVAALVGALLIQIGTNLTNDYYDFRKGADTPQRLGPVRVTQAGLVAPRTVLTAAALCFAFAVGVGLFLAAAGGWPVVAIGLCSILAGWAYTGGPAPLGYLGLGELFVLLFFGFVAVAGTAWVQALRLPPGTLLCGLSVGCTATLLIVVNNLRDIPTDRVAGKHTLAARFGERFARAEYLLVLAVAFLAPVLAWALGQVGRAALVSVAALPLALPPLRLVLTERGAMLNRALAGSARLQLVHGLLLAAGLWRGGPG
ncbi:MAG: 1,4-dihydroxy-2-naphthoate polyprenyltransferase [Myxococcaceae bacterium]